MKLNWLRDWEEEIRLIALCAADSFQDNRSDKLGVTALYLTLQ